MITPCNVEHLEEIVRQRVADARMKPPKRFPGILVRTMKGTRDIHSQSVRAFAQSIWKEGYRKYEPALGVCVGNVTVLVGGNHRAKAMNYMGAGFVMYVREVDISGIQDTEGNELSIHNHGGLLVTAVESTEPRAKNYTMADHLTTANAVFAILRKLRKKETLEEFLEVAKKTHSIGSVDFLFEGLLSQDRTQHSVVVGYCGIRKLRNLAKEDWNSLLKLIRTKQLEVTVGTIRTIGHRAKWGVTEIAQCISYVMQCEGGKDQSWVFGSTLRRAAGIIDEKEKRREKSSRRVTPKKRIEKRDITTLEPESAEATGLQSPISSKKRRYETRSQVNYNEERKLQKCSERAMNATSNLSKKPTKGDALKSTRSVVTRSNYQSTPKKSLEKVDTGVLANASGNGEYCMVVPSKARSENDDFVMVAPSEALSKMQLSHENQGNLQPNMPQAEYGKSSFLAETDTLSLEVMESETKNTSDRVEKLENETESKNTSDQVEEVENETENTRNEALPFFISSNPRSMKICNLSVEKSAAIILPPILGGHFGNVKCGGMRQWELLTARAEECYMSAAVLKKAEAIECLVRFHCVLRRFAKQISNVTGSHMEAEGTIMQRSGPLDLRKDATVQSIVGQIISGHLPDFVVRNSHIIQDQKGRSRTLSERDLTKTSAILEDFSDEMVWGMSLFAIECPWENSVYIVDPLLTSSMFSEKSERDTVLPERPHERRIGIDNIRSIEIEHGPNSEEQWKAVEHFVDKFESLNIHNCSNSDLIFIPIVGNDHWSLAVFIGMSSLYCNMSVPGSAGPTCLYFLDSMGQNSVYHETQRRTLLHGIIFGMGVYFYKQESDGWNLEEAVRTVSNVIKSEHIPVEKQIGRTCGACTLWNIQNVINHAASFIQMDMSSLKAAFQPTKSRKESAQQTYLSKIRNMLVKLRDMANPIAFGMTSIYIIEGARAGACFKYQNAKEYEIDLKEYEPEQSTYQSFPSALESMSFTPLDGLKWLLLSSLSTDDVNEEVLQRTTETLGLHWVAMNAHNPVRMREMAMSLYRFFNSSMK